MLTIDVIIRILAAGIIGALIGTERKISGKPAGVATHFVVCLGAALIVLIQQKIDQDALKMIMENKELITAVKLDTARMPAQVVSGIGFLGAGVILHSKTKILGITTASTIWITACIGMAVGFGYFDIAVFTTIFLMIVLFILKKHISFDYETDDE